ncbi:rhodanese-like domain-containing protein [Brevibacillus borstelensis]|uniref:rhodanese-like domain-containing protein n=1 Tax=Brevibacillus borstelensis TaxID=45462 RepID=UPI00046AF9A6|nr:rhodanese-like domain-containing protein [Brevibacillus borstelensis]MCC0567115.1 rhodanese-like domain-containing protein [Brevibacillus borstelensis]MCM3473437.1 rhodanese-like domain-containing protein [Brevibacillus borstelensis]MCM3561475.1 rhodanese-like domain-containing protein [Brevibacillus borstelensis]MCM3593612.1 rhodanese-like domain-containing protein [Brevibacillus borstelensis]MED1850053.1 rhodanese-like domain-containing protein [Brevibacillus borstelensis]
MYKTWQDILPQEVENKAVNQKEVQLIDVRNPDEYVTARIKGSTLIPLNELPVRVNEIDKDKEVICICRSGNRSGKACEYLSSLGYNNVKNMVGGMLEWRGNVEKD